jgi:hypothetical protein
MSDEDRDRVGRVGPGMDQRPEHCGGRALPVDQMGDDAGVDPGPLG